jgi:hypothetical protein
MSKKSRLDCDQPNHMFPIMLNMQRQSTYGLSTLGIAIAAIGKTTDFAHTYMQIMRMQYLFLAYFSSTMALIQTLQVLLRKFKNFSYI